MTSSGTPPVVTGTPKMTEEEKEKIELGDFGTVIRDMTRNRTFPNQGKDPLGGL